MYQLQEQQPQYQQYQQSQTNQQSQYYFLQTLACFNQNNGSGIDLDRIIKCSEYLNRLAYYITGIIGFGIFGITLKGIEETTQDLVAIKVFVVENEELRMSYLQQTSQLFNTHFYKNQYQDNNNQSLYIITKFCQNSSLQPINNALGIIKVAKQIIQNVQELHEQNVIHGNLKPTNILFDDNWGVKINDIGLNNLIINTQIDSSTKNLLYQPIEQIHKKKVKQSDHFAIGCIMYYMCNIQIENDLFLNNSLKKGIFPERSIDQYSSILKIAQEMMTEDYNKRIGFNLALQKLIEVEQKIMENRDAFQLVNHNEIMDIPMQNGQKSGEGRIFYNNGQLKFKGIWKLDKKNGKGKSYNEKGDWIEVNFTNDVMQGTATEYYANKSIKFEGQYVKGVRSKLGTEYYPNNTKYEGNWENNLRHGSGKLSDMNNQPIYCGSWSNGVYHNVGWLLERVGNDGIVYHGDFKYGFKHGKGKEYIILNLNNNSSVVAQTTEIGYEFKIHESAFLSYEGQYVYDQKEGSGNMYFQDTDPLNRIVFKGEFENGKYIYGELTTKDNKKYIGQFKNQKKHGNGILFCILQDRILYTGQFSDDLYSGQGKLCNEDRTYIQGIFENNKCIDGIKYSELNQIISNIPEPENQQKLLKNKTFKNNVLKDRVPAPHSNNEQDKGKIVEEKKLGNINEDDTQFINIELKKGTNQKQQNTSIKLFKKDNNQPETIKENESSKKEVEKTSESGHSCACNIW